MKIFGHEYGFAYTVGAAEDIKRLTENSDGMTKTEVNAKAAMILSEWHERAESLRAQAEGREYIAAPLEKETIDHLTFAEFESLVDECSAVIDRDSTRTVEAEDAAPQKKTDAAAP